jgi:hypothetical protein
MVNMKKRILAILVCVLFLTTGIVSASNSLCIEGENSRRDRLFVIGRMEEINFNGSSIDFVVINFVIIKDGKDVHKLNNGETIRFYAPMFAVLFNINVIGFFSDWVILE